jgi:hypothetical protein
MAPAARCSSNARAPRSDLLRLLLPRLRAAPVLRLNAQLPMLACSATITPVHGDNYTCAI